MKTLVVEDDATSRAILKEVLKAYGTVSVAVNGQQALEALRSAWAQGEPFDLITLDIMMPEVDGQAALRQIREAESAWSLDAATRSKIVMTTALDDPKNVSAAFSGLCDAYLVKPIRKASLLEELQKLGLLP